MKMRLLTFPTLTSLLSILPLLVRSSSSSSYPSFELYLLEQSGITNKALELVMNAVKPGADVYELCRLGDDFIEEQTAKLYNKKVRSILRFMVVRYG